MVSAVALLQMDEVEQMKAGEPKEQCWCGCGGEWGKCHCGCGSTTNVSTKTRSRRGDLRGRPFLYLRGHHMQGRRGESHPAFGKKATVETRRKQSETRRKPVVVEKTEKCWCGCGRDWGKCHCDCGLNTPISARTITRDGVRRGYPIRYIALHHNRVKRHSAETRKKISTRNKGRHHKAETKERIGNSHRGQKRSLETRKNISRKRHGNDLILSPYLPEVSIFLNNGRWVTSGKTRPHARLVYQHFFGEIPKGYVVHHKNGTPSDDRPENLMAVPIMWNFYHFPLLSRGFGVPEPVVTQVYERLVPLFQDRQLFIEVCKVLLQKADADNA